MPTCFGTCSASSGRALLFRKGIRLRDEAGLGVVARGLTRQAACPAGGRSRSSAKGEVLGVDAITRDSTELESPTDVFDHGGGAA